MANQTTKSDVFITTSDNPFDYFTQFDDWYAYDQNMGYYTLEYMGRLARLANDLSDEEERIEIESTIDKIIEINGSMYKKIYANS